MATMNLGSTAIASLGLLLCLSAPAQALTVRAGDAAAAPGQAVEIGVTLAAGPNEAAAGVEADLGFDPRQVLIPIGEGGRPDCSANLDIGKPGTAFSFRPLGCDPRHDECIGVHAVVVALDNTNPIPSGSVLFWCRVKLSAQAPAGQYALSVTKVLFAPPQGGDRPAQGAAGAITALDMTPSPEVATPTTGRSGNGGGGCRISTVASPQAFWLALFLVLCCVRWWRRVLR